ncbi:MAG: hypothetical protein H0T18_04880 [Chloroflexia bacterium]|nr:hypothetical protein [Chloroflexia bacterium]
MNRRAGIDGPGSGRVHWGSYGFFAGIILGVLMGWFFAGFIGAFVRVAVVVLAVVPLVLLYIAWRKVVSPFLRRPADQEHLGPMTAIETHAIVHGKAREPQPR